MLRGLLISCGFPPSPSPSAACLQVLPASDAVQLAWSLAVMKQYDTALYRNVTFRASRLPDGVPGRQAHVALLQQLALLASVEAAPAADSVLPAWLAEAGPAASRAVPEQWAAAEALRDALTAAGREGAAVKRLAYGECVVLLPAPPRGGPRGAVVPWWEGSLAANAAGEAVGSALVAQRVLRAAGMRVVLASSSLEQTMAACAQL